MPTLLTGKPSIQEPRDGSRALQSAIINIRERLRAIDATVNEQIRASLSAVVTGVESLRVGADGPFLQGNVVLVAGSGIVLEADGKNIQITSSAGQGPDGENTSVQFNDNGLFNGSSQLLIADDQPQFGPGSNTSAGSIPGLAVIGDPDTGIGQLTATNELDFMVGGQLALNISKTSGFLYCTFTNGIIIDVSDLNPQNEGGEVYLRGPIGSGYIGFDAYRPPSHPSSPIASWRLYREGDSVARVALNLNNCFVVGSIAAYNTVGSADGLYVHGPTQLISTLAVTGAATLNSTLGVSGATTLSSVTVSGQANLNGNVIIAGKVQFNPSTPTRAPIIIVPGTPPTTPSDGDLWTTTDGLYVRVAGTTVGPLVGGSNVVTSINSMVGDVTLQAGTGITLTAQSGNVILLEAAATAGVNSLNGEQGDLVLQAGSNVTITPLSGGVFEIAATGGGGGDYLTFVGQAASPGANTLYMDDGTNYVANSMVWPNDAVLLGEVSIGDPGTEQGSIDINGATFDAILKVNEFGGTRDGSLILHRHATTASVSAVQVFARARGNTSSHTDVNSGDELGRLVFAGWATASYYRAAEIIVEVDGSPGATDMPGRILFKVTPDGSATPAEALGIYSDKRIGLGTDGYMTFDEHSTAPGTPAAGSVALYAKSDGYLYSKDDAGTETQLGAGGGGGVTSVNSLLGAIVLQGGGATSVAVESGNVIRISSTASGGVDSINALVGDVTIEAGSNVTITTLSGNVISISSTGGGGASFADVVLMDGAYRYYRLDDSATTSELCVDSSTSGVNGTFTGTGVTYGSGSMVYDGTGGSVTFDGTSGGMFFPMSLSGAGPGSSMLLCECIVNISGTSLKGTFMYINYGTYRYGIGVGSTTMDANGNNLVMIQENHLWYATSIALGTGDKHVAMMIHKASNTIAAFLDGILVYVGTLGTPAGLSEDDSSVGAANAGTRPFAGQIGEAAVFYWTPVGNRAETLIGHCQNIVWRHYCAYKRGQTGL